VSRRIKHQACARRKIAERNDGRDAMSTDKTKAREADILGKPLRIAARRPAEIEEDTLALIAPPKGYGTEGELPEVFLVMAHNPELLKVHKPMGSYFITQGKLPPRDRELLILRNAWLCQAPYEWGEHVGIGKRVGITSEEIERVIAGPDAAGWTEHERALLTAVADLHGNAMIGDAAWDILAKTLSNAQMLEIPVLVGQYQATAYLQNSMRLPLRPGNAGLAAR
jgi:alkylhydroperoxidase family enzyme